MASDLPEDRLPAIKDRVESAAPGEERNRKRAPRARLTADQQRLAQKYMPMAKALAKPLKLTWPNESTEFESSSMSALVEAAQSYDADRLVKFATFARYRIWGALRDTQRALITAARGGELEGAPTLTPLSYDSEERGRVLGSEPDPFVGAELESTEFVEWLFRKLPAKHAEACRQIYIHGKTQGEAAVVLGCSKSRLSYLHKQALEMINEAWAYHNSLHEKPLAKK
jgi:RNA polymerase sigma factor (sigma-70 family)